MADRALKRLLQSVLDRAHREHIYIDDQYKHGKREHWAIDLEGDCEDFALFVRQELLAQGLEPNLVLCRTENGVGHLVVSVQGWVLDNRYTVVRNKDFLPYTWLKIGTPDGTWYDIA